MFFIGYTISAMIVGLIYGSVLYASDEGVSCRKLLPKLIISMLLVTVVVSLGLNPMWTFYTTGIPFKILFLKKTVKVVLIPLKVATMYYTVSFLENKLNKMMC